MYGLPGLRYGRGRQGRITTLAAPFAHGLSCEPSRFLVSLDHNLSMRGLGTPLQDDPIGIRSLRRVWKSNAIAI